MIPIGEYLQRGILPRRVTFRNFFRLKILS